MNRTIKVLSLLTLTGVIGVASLKFIPQSNATNILGAAATFESEFDQKPESLYTYNTQLSSHGKINVRSGPGTHYSVNYVVSTGDAVILRNDAQGNDGYRWYYMSFKTHAFSGWVREDLIASTPDFEEAEYEAHENNRLPEQYVVLSSKYQNSRINVRTGPGTNYRVQHYGLGGDQVAILDSAPGNDGYYWYELEFVQSRAQGWVREDLIAFIED